MHSSYDNISSNNRVTTCGLHLRDLSINLNYILISHSTTSGLIDSEK